MTFDAPTARVFPSSIRRFNSPALSAVLRTTDVAARTRFGTYLVAAAYNLLRISNLRREAAT